MGKPREEVNGTTTRPRLPLQGRAATRARDLISCHHADLLGLSALMQTPALRCTEATKQESPPDSWQVTKCGWGSSRAQGLCKFILILF